jgi:hypothetical protein
VGSEILYENNYYRKTIVTAIGVAPDTTVAWTLHAPATIYQINAIVKVDKVYYKCIKVTVANTPVTDVTYWSPYTFTTGADAWSIATEPDESNFPVWAAETAYQAGTEVIYQGGFYRARVNVQAGNLPTSTDWQKIKVYSEFIRSINFEQDFTTVPASATTPATEIGEVIHVYAQDPRIARYAERVNFWVTEEGIIVGSTQFTNITPLYVYVEFTKRPKLYNTNSSDSDFPRVISEYVKFAAAADALREDGQFDKAVYMDGLAADALQKEIDIIELKQGQTRLQSNRRDLFPSTPMQRTGMSPIASVMDRNHKMAGGR